MARVGLAACRVVLVTLALLAHQGAIPSMAHPLSEIFVRADWREITQRIVRQDTRHWAAMRFAVIGVAVLAQLLTLVLPSWSIALGVGLFCALFWGFPLYWLGRPSARACASVHPLSLNLSLNLRPSARPSATVAHARAVCVASAIAVGVAIVGALVIAPATIGGTVRSAAWPIGLAIPFVGWCVAVILLRTFPHPMRAFGLTGDAWPANLVIGAAVGAALGFHLLLVVNDLPGGGQLGSRLLGSAGATRTVSAVAWFISFQLGLRVLGEELFFRGLGFHLLRRVGASDRGLTAWLVLLNLFAYLWLAGQGRDPMAGLLVAYGGVMAFVCTRLRLSRESLLPGLACQAVFVLFVAVVI